MGAMPAPQLHLTFGELCQHHTGLPVPLRRACAAEPAYTRLGAIFHDLPYYYAPMVFEAVRYGLGAPAWETSSFCRRFLKRSYQTRNCAE